MAGCVFNEQQLGKVWKGLSLLLGMTCCILSWTPALLVPTGWGTARARQNRLVAPRNKLLLIANPPRLA